ncbi:MAG: cob(I)yrinic acid a,c-diamide adenosyltransferase [Peptococcaceae bacterium]|nr:MAG: cob(I)yrinic acid a,c-diamide adenosyltransferase [Peptococcaceae bacterium]
MGKGLLLVFTGDGKGKTTAALGMALRAWGQGMKVLVLQFIKGRWEPGELKAAGRLGPDFVIRQMGEGFLRGITGQVLEIHRQAARKALLAALDELKSGCYGMVVLDEILYAVKFGLLSLEELLALVSEKPGRTHLVLTGRSAPPEIVERADLVTEMRAVKHHFAEGVYAQKGIEF